MNKVLVVVDMQNDFITGTLGTPEAQSIVPNIVAKIQQEAAAGTYIVCTQDTHHKNYLETNEGKHLPVVHCLGGSVGWRIEDSVTEAIFKAWAPYDAAWVRPVEKDKFGDQGVIYAIDEWIIPDYVRNHYEDPSFSSDTGKGYEIEFIGLCTGICVLSNAILAKTWFPEATISVDASCCACVTPQSHDTALSAMQLCQIEIKNRGKEPWRKHPTL